MPRSPQQAAVTKNVPTGWDIVPERTPHGGKRRGVAIVDRAAE
jgi:hypothetical protein